jgi:hypothetical protein
MLGCRLLEIWGEFALNVGILILSRTGLPCSMAELVCPNICVYGLMDQKEYLTEFIDGIMTMQTNSIHTAVLVS